MFVLLVCRMIVYVGYVGAHNGTGQALAFSLLAYFHAVSPALPWPREYMGRG